MTAFFLTLFIIAKGAVLTETAQMPSLEVCEVQKVEVAKRFPAHALLVCVAVPVPEMEQS